MIEVKNKVGKEVKSKYADNWGKRKLFKEGKALKN